VSGDGYDVGNVRYYATNNKAYLCNTLITVGTTTPPPSDANWTEFQTGSNGEDVWFPFTAPVLSSIVGDRLSVLEIGNITCVGDVGSYLEITADPNENANALVQSAGALGLIGNTAVQVVATTGDITTASLTGAVDILSIEQNILIQAQDPTNGVVLITGGVGVGIESDTTITLESQGSVSITAVAGTIDTLSTGATNITSSLDDVNITSTTANITLTSDLATTIDASDTMGLTSFGNMTLTSTNNDINLTTTTGSTNITSGGEIDLEATGGNIRIRSTTGDVNITSTTGNVAITTPTGGNVAVNTYYPPLTIYKNATIGSAISRPINSAEVQVYPQTYTLKANTQYLLNMSYAGLTENVSTATPNSNWYYLYRIHQGTTPLSTANLWGLAQQFNSTAQAGGVSVSFMTTTAGTYTGRFYIRNQSTATTLTIANISATITEIF
jgi:hypothetical protein